MTMQSREADLQAVLSQAVLLADGDAVEAAALLIPAVADFLDVPRESLHYGRALPTIYAADETREDEADLVACEACKWEAALTPEGRASLDAAQAARDAQAPQARRIEW
jgi:hypothetical protein